MKELEVVEINNTGYVILKEVNYKDETFLYLSNINDEEDTMIRKMKNDELIPLATDKEFELACNLLVKEGLL